MLNYFDLLKETTSHFPLQDSSLHIQYIQQMLSLLVAYIKNLMLGSIEWESTWNSDSMRSTIIKMSHFLSRDTRGNVQFQEGKLIAGWSEGIRTYHRENKL